MPAGNHTNLESAPPLSIRCDLLEMISSLASACSATSLYQFVWGLLLRGVNFGSGLYGHGSVETTFVLRSSQMRPLSRRIKRTRCSSTSANKYSHFNLGNL